MSCMLATDTKPFFQFKCYASPRNLHIAIERFHHTTNDPMAYIASTLILSMVRFNMIYLYPAAGQ